MTVHFRKVPSLASISVFFMTLFTFVSSPASASEARPDKLEIRGKIQMWRRICEAPRPCSLPQPMGSVQELSGTIEPPTPGHGTTLSLKSHISVDDDATWNQRLNSWEVEVQIFRKTKANPTDTSYTAYQVTLKDEGAAKLQFLCSSYEPEHLDGLFFPVGACGGMIPAAEDGVASGAKTMVGVSFFR